MAYVIDTGALSQTGLAVEAPARVMGFVTPFGKSPPNFTAQTLVNFSGVPEALVVDWAQKGSTTAFMGLTATSTTLQLDLTGVDALHSDWAGDDRSDNPRDTADDHGGCQREQRDICHRPSRQIPDGELQYVCILHRGDWTI